MIFVDEDLIKGVYISRPNPQIVVDWGAIVTIIHTTQRKRLENGISHNFSLMFRNNHSDYIFLKGLSCLRFSTKFYHFSREEEEINWFLENKLKKNKFSHNNNLIYMGMWSPVSHHAIYRYVFYYSIVYITSQYTLLKFIEVTYFCIYFFKWCFLFKLITFTALLNMEHRP